MENFNDFKKAHYKQNACVMAEGSVINFNPDSLSEVVGAEKMTYDEYLYVQISSLGKTRSYFELCLFNHVIKFKGQIERINKGNVCFKRIYISGMYPDGTMFDGSEDHVWMDKKGFEDLRVGDSIFLLRRDIPLCKDKQWQANRLFSTQSGNHNEDSAL